MVRLTKRLKKEIKAFVDGSIYCGYIAKTADCYAFSLYHNSKNKIDFQGGWDWSKNLVDKFAEWIYLLDTKEFKKL